MKKRILVGLIILLGLILSFLFIVVNKSFDVVFPNYIWEVTEGERESQPKGENLENEKIPDAPDTSEKGLNATTPKGGQLPEYERLSSQSSAGSKEKYSEETTVEEIAKNISFSDKRRILRLVAKRLTADDIKYLLGLLKGGLTESEKQQAVKLALKRFTPEEIEEIRALYKKYKHIAK